MRFSERFTLGWSRPLYFRTPLVTDIIFPLWCPMLLLSAVGLATFIPRRRSCAAPLCSRCGYNLTGNVSGICPECGTPVPLGAAPPAGSADAPEEGNTR